MKTAKLLLTVMVGVMLLGAVALAEENAPGERRRQRAKAGRGDRQQRRQARGEFRKNIFERMVKELDLTADQQTQVKQIFDTHNQAIENWMKENGENVKSLHEQIRKARKEKDTEALKSLRKKMAEAMKGRRELREARRKQIEAVLTDEQKAKAKEMMRQGRRAVIGAHMVRRALGQVKLTDKQEEQIKKIVADTKAEAEKTDASKGKGELWRKAIETIKSDVLTKKQAKKFEEATHRMKRRQGRMSLLAHLDLTDDQKAKSKKIREKYQDKIKNAKGEERWELVKKMREELESILTDEQKAKAKKHRERNMRRFREGVAGVLDLTDDQKAQAKKIRESYRDKIKDAKPEERRELFKKMQGELESILTDEQKAKVKKHREERKERWQNRQERRQGRRGRRGPAEDDKDK
jgi:Spy/CpxP family protein refolding chaperone